MSILRPGSWGPTLRRARRQLGAASGYTLIELVGVLAVCTVVLGTLMTIVEVVLHQSSRTFTKTEVTASVRSTVQTIMNELDSACLSVGDPPIQAGSSGSTLIFTTAYGKAAAPTPVQHTIAFNAATGSLTDTTAAGTVTLLAHVSPAPGTPVFQYYAYEEPTNSGGQPYTDASGDPYMMLLDGTTPVPGTSTIPAPQPLTVPLSAGDAAQAVEVVMTLTAAPSGTAGSLESTNTSAGANPLTDSPETVTDSAVLRLSPAANHVGAGTIFGPCE